MSERRYDDTRLEAALLDLGRSLAYPSRPDLPARVRTQLTAQPRHRVTLSWRPALPVLAAAALLAGVLAAAPPARTAIASWFRVAGVQLGWVSTAPAPLGHNLALGRRVSLAQAERAAYFPVYLPTLPALGKPDAVYVNNDEPGERVSLVYRPRAGLPRARQTGVGLLVTEFEAQAAPDVLKKLLIEGTRVLQVDVNGRSGWWIEGAPHVVYYQTPRQGVVADTVRLAGNVLLLQEGIVTVRLELAGDNQQAITIAASLRAQR